MYPAVADEANRVLHWLDTRKIVITGHSGDYQGIQYKDDRSKEEPEPSAYDTVKPKKNGGNFGDGNR